KNDFISSVSHELRTPLTAIRGWGETLITDGDLEPETAKKGIEIIMSETQRLSNMVEELLDFSRMQGGRLHLETERLDVVAELSDAVLMYTQRAKQENKTLSYEEPEFFAPLLGDKNRLRQVFVNILDNALKYSDSGDSVTVTAALAEGILTVTVSDTGIGIAQDDLPKVKDKFYKGKSTRRGSGIGLAVADEIISMHGGSLSLNSIKDSGTTVTIKLPITA
ncbi:MAG: HAMP domain-containing sensor histidine kinase, partial [Angelakisella sp.]